VRLTLSRARITISINSADQTTDQDLVTLDLALNLTIADLKGFVEAETRTPQASQHFYLNGQALQDDSLTLEAVGIKDGELLAMMVNSRGTQQSSQTRRTRPGVSSNPEPQDAARIEEIRSKILASPDQRLALRSQNKDLADVLDDPARFRETWLAMLTQRDQQQRERENQIRLLNEDPFNAEAQKRIEEIIRMEKIQENLQYAYEYNPAGTRLSPTLMGKPNVVQFLPK
jgi:DNA damage-inducible protein 1